MQTSEAGHQGVAVQLLELIEATAIHQTSNNVSNVKILATIHYEKKIVRRCSLGCRSGRLVTEVRCV